MTTIAYAVKRKLRDAVDVLVSDGSGPLGDFTVTYAFRPGRQSSRHIYFGGVRTNQADDASAGQNDTLVREAATVTMYIRVVLSAGAVPGDQDPVEEAERMAEEAGDAFGAWLGPNRDFAGQGTHAALGFVFGDYSETDTEVAAVLAYAVTVTGYVDLTQQR
jgi:hypothetical protein